MPYDYVLLTDDSLKNAEVTSAEDQRTLQKRCADPDSGIPDGEYLVVKVMRRGINIGEVPARRRVDWGETTNPREGASTAEPATTPASPDAA